MNTITKSIVVASGLSAAVSLPLITQADTTVFSSQGPYVETSAQNGNLYFTLAAFENASKSKSFKDSSSVAYASGFYDDGTTSYYFNGDTTAIEFEANGTIPNKVIASGSITGTWVACDKDNNCVDYAVDTVQFSVEAKALTNQADNYRGSRQQKGGVVVENSNYDGTTAPAVLNNSFITSAFGTANPTGGNVGQFKSHSVQIIK